MENFEYSMPKIAHEQIMSFISKAKEEGIFVDGIRYLSYIALQDTDNKFEIRGDEHQAKENGLVTIDDWLKKKSALSYGFTSNDDEVIGKVSKLMQKYLHNFFLDKTNLSIAKEENDETKKTIEGLFDLVSAQLKLKKSSGVAVTAETGDDYYNQAMNDTLLRFVTTKHGVSPAAIRYLASLSITGNVVSEVVGTDVTDVKHNGNVIKTSKDIAIANTKLVDELNERAKQFKIITKGYISKKMRGHLKTFLFSDAINSFPYEGVGKQQFNYVQTKLNSIKSARIF
ncbi:MAG: hypothetical protein AABY33_08220 [Pseudomonadota bacterium]